MSSSTACWRAFYAFALATVLALSGCGSGGAVAPPKPSGELTEEEKQQIRDLNQQRAEEWGMPVKK